MGRGRRRGQAAVTTPGNESRAPCRPAKHRQKAYPLIRGQHGAEKGARKLTQRKLREAHPQLHLLLVAVPPGPRALGLLRAERVVAAHTSVGKGRRTKSTGREGQGACRAGGTWRTSSHVANTSTWAAAATLVPQIPHTAATANAAALTAGSGPPTGAAAPPRWRTRVPGAR